MLLLQEGAISEITECLTEIDTANIDVMENAMRIREVLGQNELLTKLTAIARSVLREQGFVHVRSATQLDGRQFVSAWACLLGEPFRDRGEKEVVIPSHVRPGESLMGNQLRELPLHTDYSMLDRPPRLTISFCLSPDSVPGLGVVSLVDVEALAYGLSGGELLDRLRNIGFPFAAQNAANETDIFDSPIISNLPGDHALLVRYHRSRIAQGFRFNNTNATRDQSQLIIDFENWAAPHTQSIQPASGDLLIIDNYRMLHGRGRCSVSVGRDGVTAGRQMLFAFAN